MVDIAFLREPGHLQVIEFRWAQMVFDRFTARDLQFLGSEYLPCGHLPSDRALVFVENHDRQSNCHVPDYEVSCVSLTVQDGDIYKASTQSTAHPTVIVAKHPMPWT